MRLTSSLVVFAAALSLTAAAPLNVERYQIDKSHTSVAFSVRHMMVTNVKGSFRTFDGEILLDEQDITKSSANFTIETASVDTNHQRRDNDLRSDNFFNSAEYPTMTFTSTRVERDGNQLTLVGNLTIRDVTREVRIPFELAGPVVSSNGRKRIGAEGALTINRFDFGLKYNRMTEAVAVVGPDVDIELNVEAFTPAQVPSGD